MQVDKQFNPKEGVEWAPNYHGTLYNLTDDGVQVGGQGALPFLQLLSGGCWGRMSCSGIAFGSGRPFTPALCGDFLAGGVDISVASCYP